MNEFNNFTLVGRICKDAEVKNFEKKSIVRFGIFLNAQKKKEGQQYPKLTIVNFERFIKKDDNKILNILKKGNLVKVQGMYDVDAYTDKQGNEVVKEKRIALNIEEFSYPEKNEDKEK